MHNILAYVAVIAVGAVVTLVANVPARKISLRIGYTALPDERKVHQVTTPYGGGAAMLVGFCVALLVAMAIPALRNIILSSHEMFGVLLAAGVIFVVGVLDDFREMSAPAKVAGQFLAASILYFSGATMYQLKTALRRIHRARSLDPADHHGGVGLRALERGQSHRRARRLGRRHRRDRVGHALSLRSALRGPRTPAQQQRGTVDRGPHLRHLSRFLTRQLSPAKLFMGDAGALMLGLLMSASTMVIGGGPTGERRDVLLLRTAVDSRVHPRRPVDRRRLGVRSTNGVGTGISHPGQEPHSPPIDAAWATVTNARW